MNFQDLFRKSTRVESKKAGMTAEEERIIQLEEEINTLKKKDLLTGVLNRLAFSNAIDELVMEGERPGLLLVDIDGMQTVNTRYGYPTGDHLLKEMAGLLEYCAPDRAAVGRLEGNIFSILIPKADQAVMSEVGNRILFSVRELKADQMGISDDYYKIRVSIGSSLWDKKARFDKYELLQQAMAALMEAKTNGRDQQIEFSENQALFLNMQAKREAKIEIELGMRRALEREEFFQVFQPQYDIESRMIVGLEMLNRWQHPQKGLLYPSYYLSTFESNRFIIELDLYMFEKACQILNRWMKEKHPVVPISCNFSGLHCHNPFWADQLYQITQKYQVSPTYLKIELGERSLMEEKEKMTHQIAMLREKGFRVSIQGFGAGFSSVGVLQNTPVDGIKLDRSIIMNDFSQEKNQMIFAGILSISQMLKLRVYCVGVESKKQEEVMKRQGCVLAQGNYYCPPVSLAEAEALLLENSRDMEENKREDYSLEQGREFIETILDDYYITKNIERIEGMVTDEIEWKDIFTENEQEGKEQWEESFQEQIKERVLHMNLYSCFAHLEGNHKVVINGDGSIQEQIGGRMKDRRFCLYAECVEVGSRLKLDRLRMVPILSNIRGDMKELEDMMKESGAIRQSYALLDSMYGKLPVGIIRLDIEIDMMITYMNDAMFDIIGYTREEFFGGEIQGNLRRIVYPEDLETVYMTSYHQMTNGEVKPIIFRYVRKDGRTIKICQYQYNIVGINGRGEVQTICYPIEEPDKG